VVGGEDPTLSDRPVISPLESTVAFVDPRLSVPPVEVTDSVAVPLEDPFRITEDTEGLPV
jgi:hypothetical protein